MPAFPLPATAEFHHRRGIGTNAAELFGLSNDLGHRIARNRTKTAAGEIRSRGGGEQVQGFDLAGAGEVQGTLAEAVPDVLLAVAAVHRKRAQQTDLAVRLDADRPDQAVAVVRDQKSVETGIDVVNHQIRSLEQDGDFVTLPWHRRPDVDV